MTVRDAARRGSDPEKAAAIERATGLPWDRWVRTLEDGGAADAGHSRIAEIALAAMGGDVENPEWWAQSVAVAYEQHTGRRVKGQTHDGWFQVSATRTLPGSMDDAFRRWQSAAEDLTEIDGTPIVDGPRTTGTEKRRHWRIGLADGSRAAVSAEAKGPEKAVLSATHTKLSSSEEVERRRAAWKELLKTL